MKYMFSGFLVLLMLVIVCISCASYISKEVDKTTAFLQQAIDAQEAGQKKVSEEFLYLASEYWDTRLSRFAMMLRHDSVDEVSREFERLKAYARSKDDDDFLSNCAALLSSLDHIRDLEWPYLHNIL